MIDEGYIKFESRWKKSGPLDNPEIADLVRWRTPLHLAGLIGHFPELGIGYGNLSARVGKEGHFVISGTQTGHLSKLGSEHFSLVTGFDLKRNLVTSQGASEASSESMTHAMLYELSPEIRAVVHIHNDALWVALKDQVPTTDHQVAYGTPEMAGEFDRLARETEFLEIGVATMAGHEGGLISIGITVQEAAEKLLTLYESHLT